MVARALIPLITGLDFFLGDGVWEQDKSLLHSRQDFPLLRHPEGHKRARRFRGLHDSPGLHTIHHTQRETAWKWVPVFFSACSSCQRQISQVNRAGAMSLNWHSMTQLTPFSAEQGTLGTQDVPDFSVDCGLKYGGGGFPEGQRSNRTVWSHRVQGLRTQRLVQRLMGSEWSSSINLHF